MNPVNRVETRPNIQRPLLTSGNLLKKMKNKMAAATGFWNRRGILAVCPTGSQKNACKEIVDTGKCSKYALDVMNITFGFLRG